MTKKHNVTIAISTTVTGIIGMIIRLSRLSSRIRSVNYDFDHGKDYDSDFLQPVPSAS